MTFINKAHKPSLSQRKMTCKGKSSSCKTSIPTPKLSKISDQASTSKGKVLKPFWNPQLTEISSKLWLPTKTDYADSDLISSSGLLSETLERSWFSSKLSYPERQSLLKICLQSSAHSHSGCPDLEVIRTKLVKLLPTSHQKKVFKNWTDVSRYVFNSTIDYIRTCQNFAPSWMDIKKDMSNFLPDWCRSVPFQVKGIAIKEACAAFWKASGHPSFRKYKDPEQSCFLPKSAIKKTGLYPTISGKGLRLCEALPEKPMDSRLIWKFNNWWLAVSSKEKLSLPENQGRVVAIDPGVRSFISFYGEDSAGNIGEGDFSRIQRLCAHLDQLVSKRDKCKAKQKKRSITKAIRRMHAKIRQLTDELHHKSAKFLTDNYDVILLPTFETKNMSSRAGRKLRKKTVRSMLTFAHYRFKVFLKWKAKCTGKQVIDCCEAYTSKTHPQTGEVKNIGSAKWIKLENGSVANRDLVGARNILLRALVDSPMGFRFHAVDNC